MQLNLSLQQKNLLLQKVITLFQEDFDEDLSDFKAERLLEAIIDQIGPSIYNAAIDDMKIYMMNQLEDLGALFQKNV